MHLRRFYKKNQHYDYKIPDEELYKIKKERGEKHSNKLDNASYEIILDNKEEETIWLNETCNKIISNPLYYFDNLDKLTTFRLKKC
jgi:hypothetical protein